MQHRQQQVLDPAAHGAGALQVPQQRLRVADQHPEGVAAGIVQFDVQPGRIDQDGVAVAGEHHRDLHHPLVLGGVGRGGVGDVHRPGEGRLGEMAAGLGDEARPGRLGQFGEAVRVGAHVLQPQAVAPGGDDLEPPARRRQVDLGHQPPETVQLGQGLAHGRRGVADLADHRELAKVLRRPQVQGQGRFGAQRLGRMHQVHVPRPRDAVVRIGQIGRPQARPLGQGRRIGAPRHRELHQVAGVARRNRRGRHAVVLLEPKARILICAVMGRGSPRK